MGVGRLRQRKDREVQVSLEGAKKVAKAAGSWQTPAPSPRCRCERSIRADAYFTWIVMVLLIPGPYERCAPSPKSSVSVWSPGGSVSSVSV
ncbi:hypothetical protein SAMN05192539_1004156 [Paraburkholderia diazotrophica]|uniref:Uncharacterized protein n=1 Tax=Paraburkholderia diazotrophica TaxID=667676 RepID=A0A1H6TJH2_9BURK|nr:hypothetical protein SAMN05192539_1004156 [Paraburkholderia diazotrophica]